MTASMKMYKFGIHVYGNAYDSVNPVCMSMTAPMTMCKSDVHVYDRAYDNLFGVHVCDSANDNV